MLYDVLNFAVEGITKGIECLCAYRFAVLDSMYGIGRKPLFVNQMIFGNVLFKKRFIKRLITNHPNHRINFIILNLLTILNILTIIIMLNILSVFKNLNY